MVKHDSLTPNPGPLDGLVVADFSRVLAAPYATMMLADMGATVIKVEAPNGDEARQWMPPERDGKSTYFMSVNRNKQSIALDLNDPKDRETALAIIDRADIFVENFRIGSLNKFGLGPEDIEKRWPNLVHARVTGFGSGAGASLPGYDMVVQAASGFMSITGSAQGVPQRAGFAIFDVFAGVHLAMGILAALRNGGGRVETNLMSAALSSMVNATSAAVAAQVTPMRQGNDHPSLFPYGPFQAADRPLIITIGNDRQFASMVNVLGAPGLATDERFDSVKQRNLNREELRQILEDLLSARTAEEWIPLFSAENVPCGLIRTVPEGVNYAEELGLHPVVSINGEPYTANPLSFSSNSIQYNCPAPELDGDRSNILDWIQAVPPKK